VSGALMHVHRFSEPLRFVFVTSGCESAYGGRNSRGGCTELVLRSRARLRPWSWSAGPVLGLAQWFVLCRLVPHSGRWLGANALAWAIGMPLMFAGMSLLPWDGNPLMLVLGLYTLCFMTGAVVGAVHGRVLVQLTGPSSARHKLHDRTNA
jgi:hypothetical protein